VLHDGFGEVQIRAATSIAVAMLISLSLLPLTDRKLIYPQYRDRQYFLFGAECDWIWGIGALRTYPSCQHCVADSGRQVSGGPMPLDRRSDL